MVRFKTEQKTSEVPNYFRRSVQYRLLMIVFSLMLVVVLMSEAAKPSNWIWLTGTPPPSSSEPSEDSQIDPRLGTPVTNPPGVFTIEPQIPKASVDAKTKFPLGVDPTRFEAVKDDTLFRSNESGLWYDTLSSLRDASPEELESIVFQSAGFTQLYRQPDHYRGQPVQVSGTVRRAQRVAARKNEQGIEEYWQCWLFPSGTTNPIVVYALEMPESFPEGMAMTEAATFDGFFFKRWAYVASGGTMSAPLVLARTAKWEPEIPAAPVPLPPVGNIIMFSLGLAVCAAAIATLVYRRSQTVGESTQWYRERRASTSPVKQLDAANIAHPAELALRSMEELDKGTE